MPLSDYIVDVTPDGSRKGLILNRIDEKRQSISDGTVKNTVDMTAAEIADSDIIETEKVIFADTSRIDDELDEDDDSGVAMSDQLGELLDVVNSINTIDTNQGTGPFNSAQPMQLKNIPADRVLTHVETTRNFRFKFGFGDKVGERIINGADIETYDKLIDKLNEIISINGLDGTVTYVSLDYKTGEHGLVFKSNVTGQPANLTPIDDSPPTVAIVSEATVQIIFDYDYSIDGENDYSNTSVSTTVDGDNAEIYIPLPAIDDRSILTKLDSTKTYSFTFERLNSATNGVKGLEGNQRAKVIRVTGDNVTRLDTLIEEINTVLDGTATIEFGKKIPNYGLLILKSVDTEILGLSVSVADLFHEIGIPFELYSPISGGENLLQVLKFTWRYDQREWTRVIPYEWLEYRLGVGTEERGQLTASGVESSGVIVAEGESEPADTPDVAAFGTNQTISLDSGGTFTGNTTVGKTDDGFDRTSIGVGLI